MADLHQLAALLKELDDQLVTCMKCGMCQAVCPLFAQTGLEADVTRGKLSLLDGLATEILTNPEGVNEKLQRCLLCGTCEKNCPSGVAVTDIFLKARAILSGYFGLSPAKKLIFKQLLTRPQLFNKLLASAGKLQGLFSKPANALLGTSCARFQAPLIADRHFPRLADKPLHQQVPSLLGERGSSGLRVAFYPGCVVDKVFPKVALAALKILKHHGVGVYLPAGQACCGIPALSSGDRDSFESLVVSNVKAFGLGGLGTPDFDYVLTPCATCTSTLKELWPSLPRDRELRSLVTPFADKVMDVSQFLVDVLGVAPLGEADAKTATTVTYHDPCHLKNALGITAQPRTVLKASAGHRFVEMAEAGVCCGCGGSFNLQHYELSARIGDQKADNVLASGANVAATSCPACMMQIADRLSHKEAQVAVRHVLEIYADSLP